MSMSLNKQQRRCPRVRFTFQVPQNSTNGETLLWLLYAKENDDLSKEKALDAVRAFWLPLARKAEGSYSERELQDTARVAIWRLKEQVHYLASHFGLDKTEAGTTLSELSELVAALRTEVPTKQLLQQQELLKESSASKSESLNIDNFDWSLDEAALEGAA